MKSLLTTIRRAILLFQVRSLEQQLDGMAECLDVVRDPLTRQRIASARELARRELARVRANYNATLPPGRRVIWGAA